MNEPHRPRVLYLTHRVPFPPDKGDRIRNFHVLRELSKAARVWLAALADEPVTDEQRAGLARHCERVEFVPAGGRGRWARAGLSLSGGRSLSEGLFRSPALDALLARWVPEAGFAASLSSASSLAPYQRRHGLDRLPAHVDLVDVDSQKWADYAAATGGPKGWLYRLEGRRVRALERDLAGWAATVALVSRAEADLFDGFTRPGAATAATNGVDLDYYRPTTAAPTPRRCAFVGAMDYFPNVDAAVWFATEIWPAVRAEFPDATFAVVGRKPAAAVRALAGRAGVEVVGGVPDVRPYLAAAELVVCPIRVARGLQNKVIEAMAAGRPTLAAPAAVAALGATPGVHLLSPRTPAEWHGAIRDLFLDAGRRAALATAGREYVEAHHRWDRCLRPLIDRVVPPAI